VKFGKDVINSVVLLL